ncbi:NADPH-dependent FMN reductase [Kerstersia gyiorum]|uniref:NADPH-dependent FMN reductase n=1 Tax=Kerstersia gyiorum TaxID=206506 RepID=UPI00209DD170|nr:NAD(P)H-dependent oxidoreductase [Kerstersia gyiorum]MCP1632705.1 NAD(P)H-dependent FMN reductase [Kerstersia gyiorum]MCP1682316.1 NAD(P)H-dependent FMN reductase [Kerstersia gyiorum]MCP1717984.1 NAD(P)H-dependent FMN reductase [Kerstersia gyiorum]MCW2187199.1 NAD(P)H-dependent FMN reductase [Kerstersia gyiorum]
MSAKPRLHIIVSSTRPGRVGPKIAAWFQQFAAEHGGFDAHLVDLADFELPVYDEPNHPRMQNYQHEHTRRWAASVAAADAFVFVTPEYNFTAPPALFNALQYVYNEWNYKPASFVSYAYASGGLRAVQEVKTLLTSLKIVPLVEPGDGADVPAASGRRWRVHRQRTAHGFRPGQPG